MFLSINWGFWPADSLSLYHHDIIEMGTIIAIAESNLDRF